MGSRSSCNAGTESRRRAILRAALESFSGKGFTETTVEDIRRLSGASVGSIYHHFESKEMLALALYLEGCNDLNSNLLTCLTTVHPREGIKAMVRTYLDWYAQHPNLGQYMIQAANTEYLGAQVQKLRETVDILPVRLLDWLTPFMEDGTIVRIAQDLYVPLVLGPSKEFVRRWLRARLPEEIQKAREPLAEAAWIVLSTPAAISL